MFAGDEEAAKENFGCFSSSNDAERAKDDGKGGIEEAAFAIVGNKVSEGSILCVIMTYIGCLTMIIPCFFFQCGWWKAIAEPVYEMSTESCQRVVDFIRKTPSVKKLTLEVVDNTFDGDKAEQLY